MICGFALACVLLAPIGSQVPLDPAAGLTARHFSASQSSYFPISFGTQAQSPTANSDDAGKDSKNFKPPTPWFNKEEDTFDLPKDPKHLEDIERDVKEGRKEAEEVLKQIPASTNMAYQERVERVGQIVAHIANHTKATALWGDNRHNVYHYHYTVLKGDDVNAFSLPGGYIFVYEGLMQFIESDDELAGVLAHETAHAAFRHVATLEHDANKMLIYQIPILIGSILARDPSIIMGGILGSQAFVSGWTINAEKAADYGGFQFMCHSPYNPVAMLTFMERLAKHDSFYDQMLRFTIDQTHPLTRERVVAMIDDLNRAHIPIERSKASPTFRVLLKDDKDGTVDATFNGIQVFKFAGDDARDRAEAAAARLDKFFDAVPGLYEINEDDSDLSVDWKGEPLLKVEPADALASHMSPQDLLSQTVTKLKGSLFNLGYRIWEGPDF